MEDQIRLTLRLPAKVRDRLAEAAATKGRSLNAEIVHRLEEIFIDYNKDIVFLNEVIGYLVRRQDRPLYNYEIEKFVEERNSKKESDLRYMTPFDCGLIAAVDGDGASTANPFDRDEEEEKYDDWERGFDAGLPRVKAMQQGRLAAREFLGMRDNPYKEGSVFEECWNDGLILEYSKIRFWPKNSRVKTQVPEK